MDRIASIIGKTNRRIVCSANITPHDDANISKIKQYMSKMTDIPEEELVCQVVVGRDSFHEYLMIFPDPLDLFIISAKLYDEFVIYSINGDECLGLYMAEKIVKGIFAGHAKAYALSRELRAAKERIEELEHSPMPGPKFLAAQEHFAQFANIQKDKE